jgi:hypothetical protein
LFSRASIALDTVLILIPNCSANCLSLIKQSPVFVSNSIIYANIKISVGFKPFENKSLSTFKNTFAIFEPSYYFLLAALIANCSSLLSSNTYVLNCGKFLFTPNLRSLKPYSLSSAASHFVYTTYSLLFVILSYLLYQLKTTKNINIAKTIPSIIFHPPYIFLKFL